MNNAGIVDENLIKDLTHDQWRNLIDVNLSSAFYTTKVSHDVYPYKLGPRQSVVICMNYTRGLALQMDVIFICNNKHTSKLASISKVGHFLLVEQQTRMLFCKSEV